MSIIDDILGQMDQLGDADILSTSPNLRLRSGGQRTTFPVENRTGFIRCDEVKLVRATLLEQNGMPVLRVDLAVANEKIGLLSENDEESLLPIYTSPALTTWRTWSHRMHTEFMNPDMQAVNSLKAMLDANGFVPWSPRATSQTYERTSTILWDVEAKGDRVPERFKNGLRIEAATIVPQNRVAPLVTSYTSKTGEEITRPGFTGLIDALAPLIAEVIRAVKAKKEASTTEELQAANAEVDSAMNRLSVLTGRNPEGNWPLRPTLGYLTPMGGQEISFFPSRNESEQPAAPVAQVANTPVAPASYGEDPFGD